MDGKPYLWKPTLPTDMAFEALAEDVRPEMQQVAHYAMLAVAMGATSGETDDIIRALQQCERIHGFNRMNPALDVLTAAIENAVTLTSTPITLLGHKRQLASPGLFVGSLTEALAHIPASTRKFPASHDHTRIHSPYVEFEDCLLGAEIVKAFHLLSESNPQVARPYSRLVAAFRQRHGQGGTLMIEALAKEVRDQFASVNHASLEPMSPRVTVFVQAIEHKSQTHGVTLPALWRLYVEAIPA